MAEDGLEQLASQIRKYMEFARRVLRRWWLIALATLIGAGASIGLALSMTRMYESRTLISWKEALNKSRILSEEVHREDNWLRTRLQETFSSNTLGMQIIREMDLFPKTRNAVAPEVVLKEFSDRLQFGVVGLDSFWISFEYSDPYKAQQVTARLAHEFMNKNVSDRVSAAETTNAFMEKEVKRAKGEMDKIEGDLAQFVSEHPEYQIDPATGLPRLVTPQPGGTGTSTYAHVSNPELRRALARKGKLEAQLQLLLNPQGDPKVTQAKQELERARQRLLALKRQYTERHPDVQRARGYVMQVQAQVNAAMEAHSGDTTAVARLRDEIAELDQTISRLSRAKRKPAETKPDEPADDGAGGAITTKAQLEKRFYQLTRDREVAKAKLEQLSTQMDRSKVAVNLERKQAESQFVVVDRANLPRKPSRPSRSKLALAGTALGLMLGFGLAVLLVIFDPRIYNEDDLRKACDLPVLAHIPRES